MISPTFHHYKKITSTSDIASEMARKGAHEGTVVTTLQQTAGRGRRGRRWQDELDSSVLMSIILRPPKPISEFSQLSAVASLAVTQTLKSTCSLNPSIKWPNDILVSGRKISGILIDICNTPPTPAAIIGIGINVLQRSFPTELSTIATSVALENGECIDIQHLAEIIAKSVLENYELYLSSGFKDILAQWRKYIWGIGKPAAVIIEDQTIKGIIDGVDDKGALLLTDANNNQHIICAADAVNVNMDS